MSIILANRYRINVEIRKIKGHVNNKVLFTRSALLSAKDNRNLLATHFIRKDEIGLNVSNQHWYFIMY